MIYIYMYIHDVDVHSPYWVYHLSNMAHAVGDVVKKTMIFDFNICQTYFSRIHNEVCF